MEKKCKKAKWLSEEALQIAVKRSERQKRKGKIYSFECRGPKNSRKKKKASLSEQCKEIEENNRMGKTRDLFKKIRDTQGTFHAKMGSIKDRNGMDLTSRRYQEEVAIIHRRTVQKDTTQIITMV